MFDSTGPNDQVAVNFGQNLKQNSGLQRKCNPRPGELAADLNDAALDAGESDCRIALSGATAAIKMQSKKDGQVIWGKLALSLIDETQGRSVQLISIVEDITRQKKEQQELQNEKERYRLLYEDAPIPYQSLDKNGNILEVNTPWQKVLGYSAEEVIGKPFSNFLHPDSIPHFRDNFSYLLRSGTVREVEFDMVTFDERVISISCSGKIGRHPDGSFKQTYCVFQDITDQKRMQKALLESEKRFRCLADAAFEGIVLHENGIIVDVNSAFARMLGYGSNDIVGRQIEEFVVNKSIEPCVIEESPSVGEYQEAFGRKQDGTHFPVQIQNKDMPFKGRRVRVLAMRDITALKAAEEILKKMNQELERRVNERTAALLCINRQKEEEILERKKTEKELIFSEARLKTKQLKLQEMNTALRVLLQETSAARDELEEQILFNIKKLIQPIMIEFEGTLKNAEQKCISM